jgi:hypothetical protein
MDEMMEPRGLRGYLAGLFDGPGGGFQGEPTESQMEVIRALDGQDRPLSPYSVSLQADRLVTVDELLDLTDGGFIAATRLDNLPIEERAGFLLTDRGRQLAGSGR